MARRLNNHILNTSSTLTGVSITVISVVKLIEHQISMSILIDEVMSINAVLFTLASVMSYLSIRNEDKRINLAERYERQADRLFMAGLIMMTLCALLFAFQGL